ncbi:MAG: hypothetical protein KAX05_15410, partial [Bacteroidales bacterium]|nr:hypothetical protein [Bacteroidales bacterium]
LPRRYAPRAKGIPLGQIRFFINLNLSLISSQTLPGSPATGIPSGKPWQVSPHPNTIHLYISPLRQLHTTY